MKTRSLFVGFMFAILTGMIFAGVISIADAERQEHRQYDGGERRFHWETVLGYYQNMWFHTTFVLQLEDNILVRARDVYSRALHDIHESKNTKSVNRRFLAQLKKTIGDDNFNKLMDSTADGSTNWNQFSSPVQIGSGTNWDTGDGRLIYSPSWAGVQSI